MPINLEPWLILWAAITTGVLVLAIWRLMVVRHEHHLGALHVAGGNASIDREEAHIAGTLARIDFWGKTLTVVAAVLILAIGAAWLYNGWQQANKVIH